MIKNAYNGINRGKRILLEVIDFHNEKFQEKVDKDKRKGSTLKKVAFYQRQNIRFSLQCFQNERYSVG